MTLIFARQVTKVIIEKTYVVVYIICRAVGRSENPGVCGGDSGEGRQVVITPLGWNRVN
jgi:hypothetical protein